MNEFESLQKQFTIRIEDAKHVIAQYYAKRFVEAFREHLSQFKLNNHTILISSGMGSCTIVVKHKPSGKETFLHDYGYLHDSAILDELRFIEEQLDWNWCYNLNNVALN